MEVRPSVLHGDLWAGNYAAVDSRPAIFDPATYYGHHEAEFGMSWCASKEPFLNLCDPRMALPILRFFDKVLESVSRGHSEGSGF